MESSEDKHWAQRALIDPLNEPEPSAETGPGTHFRRPASDTSSLNSIPIRSASSGSKLQKNNPYRDSAASSSSNNPYRKSSNASKNPFVSENEVPSSKGRTRVSENEAPSSKGRTRGDSYPSPPPSASPRRDQFGHRSEAFGQYLDTPRSPKENDVSGGRRRGSSLGERFPGDKSHRPLDVLKQEQKAAHRAPHLRKKHIVRPDTIDNLDIVPGGGYHHEGPFDATYLARNTSYLSSPVAAVADSNEEALRATPREKILDAVERHRPLDGVASYAPGEVDRNGQTYNYKEGENMMVDLNPEGGAYKRIPGVQYHPDDIKGKGEPSFTIERNLKEHQSHSNHRREMADGIEMQTHRPRSSGGSQDLTADQMWGEGREGSSGDVRRANTTGKDEQRRSSGSMRRRFGSIRKSLGGKKDSE